MGTVLTGHGIRKAENGCSVRTERPFYLESRETEYIAKLAMRDVRTSAEEEGSE